MSIKPKVMVVDEMANNLFVEMANLIYAEFDVQCPCCKERYGALFTALRNFVTVERDHVAGNGG